MLLFRSEEELEQHLQAHGRRRGAVLTLSTLWELSQHWYATRLRADYRGRTPAEAEAIFASVGLNDPFWHT